MKANELTAMSKEQLDAIMDPVNFIGCAALQTRDYLAEVVQPILDENKESLGLSADINV